MKKAVVTGANRGIGLEFCRQLKDKGYEVYGLCRNPSAALKKLSVNIVADIDVTSSSSISRAVDAVSGEIQLLVNNAGILELNSWGAIDFDSIREQFEVNTLGPMRVTEAFDSQLGQGAKIAIVTSLMGSMADNGGGGFYGYRISKAGLNMFGVSLAIDLKGRGISVAILHPGYVNTDMTNHSGNINPDESVRGMLVNIEKCNLETSGHFWHTNGKTLPW